MAKFSILATSSLFLSVMILIPCTDNAFLNSPEGLHTYATKARALSSDSSISPANPPVQQAISEFPASITVGDFKFRIVEVTFDETAMGFVPVDAVPDDQVMFVEFELLEGNSESFKALEISVTDNSGHKSNAFIVTSGGMIQMLATVIMKSASSYYQPMEDNIAWAFLVPKGVDELYLNFPTGEMIDLTPHIKSFSCLTIQLCQEYRNRDSKPFSISGFLSLRNESFPI